MLKDALYYADLGLSVIPIHGITNGQCTCSNIKCNKPGKHPRLKWKSSTQNSLTKAQLEAWFRKHPDSNVGIVTGEISGIAVLDIDGDKGVESLNEIGLDLSKMPVTPTVRTGGGGYHLIFRMSPEAKTKSGVLQNVDVRATGGLIVAPPSVHFTGNTYAWMPGRSIGEVDFAEFDFTLLKNNKVCVSGDGSIIPKGKIPWYVSCLSGVDEGTRNDSAARLAGRYLSLGMSRAEVQFILNAWNQQNHPALEVSELEVIINSIRERERGTKKQPVGDSLDIISSILQLDLISIRRITGDDPQYVLSFSEGKCVMAMFQILSPKLFQQCVAEATNVLVRKLSAKTIPSHDRLVQLIMNCAEDIDAGIEATSTGEMIALLKDFLRGQKMIPNADQGDDIPQHGSFRSDGLIWVQLDDIVHRGSQRWGMRIPMRNMAQRLRALGIKRKSILSDGDDKIMWGLDPDNLDKLKEKIDGE